MEGKMEEKIDEAIRNLLAMVRANVRQDEALKYTQSALNLAHAKAVLMANTKGAGT